MKLQTRLLIAGLIGVHALICASPAVWLWHTSFYIFDGDKDYTFLFLKGLAIGQANLIAFWAVFAPSSIVSRCFVALLLTELAWLIGGSSLASHYFDTDYHLSIVAIQILVSILPLAGIRYLKQLRYLPPQFRPEFSKEMQLSLRELMLSIAALGLLLALSRMLNPITLNSMALQILGPALLVVDSTTSMVSVLPCLWIATSRRFRPLTWLVALPLVSLPVALVQLAVLRLHPTISFPLEFLRQILTLNLAQGLSVCATLAILRWQGFRWVRIRSGTNQGQALPPRVQEATVAEIPEEANSESN